MSSSSSDGIVQAAQPVPEVVGPCSSDDEFVESRPLKRQRRGRGSDSRGSPFLVLCVANTAVVADGLQQCSRLKDIVGPLTVPDVSYFVVGALVLHWELLRPIVDRTAEVSISAHRDVQRSKAQVNSTSSPPPPTPMSNKKHPPRFSDFISPPISLPLGFPSCISPSKLDLLGWRCVENAFHLCTRALHITMQFGHIGESGTTLHCERCHFAFRVCACQLYRWARMEPGRSAEYFERHSRITSIFISSALGGFRLV